MRIIKKAGTILLSIIMIFTLMTPVSFASTKKISLSKSSLYFDHAYTRSVEVTYSGNRDLYYDVIKGEDNVSVKWSSADWKNDKTKLYIRPRLKDKGEATVIVYEKGRRKSAKKIAVQFSNCNSRAVYSDGSVFVAWNSKLFDNMSVDYYNVYRSKEKYGTYKCIDSYIYDKYTYDYNIAKGRTYYYKIKAYGYDNKARCSKPIKVRTPLSRPSVKLRVTGKHSVLVKWNKLSGADGYRIYRASSSHGTYSVVKTIKSHNTTSWKDCNLTTGKTKYYKVRAYRYISKEKKLYGKCSSVKKATPRKNAYYEHPSYAFDEYGGVNLRTREVSYDSKGNLVFRGLALNDYCFYADYFDWIRITIYDGDKIIGKQKFYNRAINLDPYDYKMMRFVLTKGTRKKVNLRYADIYVDYQYNYTYRY